MDSGNTAWVLTATALVFFMTPGLALFYGGMVRAKHTLNMLMMNFFTIPIVTVIWVVVGYSLAFDDTVGGVIGGLDKLGLAGVGDDELLFVAFQMMFAIITPALISGAVADRMKFSAWVRSWLRGRCWSIRSPPTGVSPKADGSSRGERATSPAGW
ncbi:MAG TPA: hypothetical protein VMS74_05040 [Acidimicrobiia bacterium]|nr:hypothetical protein [Acidimicrobiia bacterium]